LDLNQKKSFKFDFYKSMFHDFGGKKTEIEFLQS